MIEKILLIVMAIGAALLVAPLILGMLFIPAWDAYREFKDAGDRGGRRVCVVYMFIMAVLLLSTAAYAMGDCKGWW